MKIEHIALWVSDLEKIREFYVQYFGAKPNDLYHNPTKSFRSYFLSFESGSRIEIMQRPDILPLERGRNEYMGLTHLAFTLGDKKKVNELTERLRNDGFEVVGEPRTTGDGYYESAVLDPEGNRIEIVA